MFQKDQRRKLESRRKIIVNALYPFKEIGSSIHFYLGGVQCVFSETVLPGSSVHLTEGEILL